MQTIKKEVIIMSKDNVKKMFYDIEKNESLKKQYIEIIKKYQKASEDTIAGKLIELGKSSGFAFSKDELIAARTELIDKINENKELGDGDLANVSGGNAFQKTVTAVSSIIFIVGCAVISLVSEHNEKGGCGDALSITKTECTKEIKF